MFRRRLREPAASPTATQRAVHATVTASSFFPFSTCHVLGGATQCYQKKKKNRLKYIKKGIKESADTLKSSKGV